MKSFTSSLYNEAKIILKVDVIKEENSENEK